MNKKNRNKILGIGFIAAASIYIANKIQFKKARKPAILDSLFLQDYDWTFGNVKYGVFGQGKPVLLVHGLGVGAGMLEWEKTIKHLTKGYRVYVIDLMGFGSSDKPNIPYSSYLYSILIRDFIKNVINEKTIVVASTSSAPFAVMAYQFESSLFSKIMLINPSGISDIEPTKTDFLLNKLINSPFIGTSIYNILSSKIAIRRFLRKQLMNNGQRLSKEMVDYYFNMSHFDGISHKYGASSFVSKNLNLNILAYLKNIQIPLHIVWGEQNEIDPFSEEVLLRNENIHFSSEIFTNAKMLPHYEKPSQFIETCQNFFE